jgi:3-hydroxyacyl-CoA dehydrogenase
MSIDRVAVVGAGFMGSGIAECKMTQEEGESLIGRVAYTTRVEDLDSVDAVVEAVTEDPRVKGTLFQQLDQQLPEAQFLASNTSSIPIAELASWTQRPERVVGLHFLVLATRTPETRPSTGVSADHKRVF